jgi:SAM-dependent methyltransferase
MHNSNSFYVLLAMYYNDIHREALVRSILYLEKLPSCLGGKFSRKKALDLGCGTGELANYLWESDWDIHGIDNSIDMINVLRARYPYISFSVSDIRELRVDGFFDLIVCFGDTINHLLGEGEWSSVFRSAKERLRDGGVLCFDVVTPYDHYEIWPNSTTVIERDEFTHIARGSFTDDGQPLLINTWFVREGDQWQRYDFKLHHRSYPLQTIFHWLLEAGLVNIIVLDGESLGHATDRSTRWVIYAFK